MPMEDDTPIDVRHRDGDEYTNVLAGGSNNWDWTHDGSGGDIVAYRLTPSTQP